MLSVIDSVEQTAKQLTTLLESPAYLSSRGLQPCHQGTYITDAHDMDLTNYLNAISRVQRTPDKHSETRDGLPRFLVTEVTEPNFLEIGAELGAGAVAIRAEV